MGMILPKKIYDDVVFNPLAKRESNGKYLWDL